MQKASHTAYSIFYRHFDLPASFPVVALLGDTWTSSPDPITRQHFHNCLEVGFLYEGRGELYMDDRVLPIAAPCLLIVPPNVPHFTRSEEGAICHFNWIYTDPIQLFSNRDPKLSAALHIYQRTLSDEDCAISLANQPKLHSLLRMILDEISGAGQYYRELTRELFHVLFLMLLRMQSPDRQQQNTSRPIGRIEPAISYIAENYMNDVSIETLAQLCYVSASHFRRLFRQVLGWSPQEYLQLIRIDRACALLYNADYSVTEIGAMVGYPSPSSFTRQFRRIYGTSPNQWRQKVRSEENPAVTAYFNALPPTTMQFFPQNYPT